MKIIPTLAPAEKLAPSLEITIPLYSPSSAISIAVLIALRIPPPIVFIFEWNSILIIPSPMSWIEASSFFQIVLEWSKVDNDMY